jgi:hypothetical protein
MNEKHQENAMPRTPLILTVPAYSFVVAMHLDCLGWSDRAAFSAEPVAKEVEPVDSVRRRPPEPEFFTGRLMAALWRRSSKRSSGAMG